jgi:hypothetical protein
MPVDPSILARADALAGSGIEIPVESSWLASVAYFVEHTVLQVTLRSGAVYHYLRVPSQTWLDLILADSPGGYLNRHIKGRFEHLLLRQA